jgi:hypothetical protein
MMAMEENEESKADNNNVNIDGRSAAGRDPFRLLLEIEAHFRAEDRKNPSLKRVQSRPNLPRKDKKRAK